MLTFSITWPTIVTYTWLTHLPVAKMAAISHTIISDAFSWMEMFVFWLKFHRSLSLRIQLTITQCWFRKWRGAECHSLIRKLSHELKLQQHLIDYMIKHFKASALRLSY